jgi:hypothetical protein
MDTRFKDETVLKSWYCIEILKYFQKEYKLNDDKLSSLVCKYGLCTLIANHLDYYDTMGPRGCAIDLKNYIEEQGGNIE